MQNFDSDAGALSENTLKKLKKHYSKTFVEHCLQPRNFQKMTSPDGHIKHTGAAKMPNTIRVLI